MELILYLALIPALGLTAQWLAWRTNLPSILLLLLFGVLLGLAVQPDEFLSELTGGGKLAGPRLLFPLVSLAVGVIMFEGGLSLRLSELREAGSAAFRLCTFGALLTLLGAAIAAHYTLGFSWRLSYLLGAILVVTGPTVIGPLLRQVRPSRRVAATLKWEGIVIDPIGAVLAVLVFEHLIEHGNHFAWGSVTWMLTKTIVVGITLGVASGYALATAFRRYLVPDHLLGVTSLSLALLLFAISNLVAEESGLITVTVMGIWLANQRHLDIETIVEFVENLRTLLIGCLFVVLGSRVDLQDMAEVGWPGLAFLALLVLIVRPASALLSLYRSPLDMNERLFVAGLAPRGIVAAAVSSIFALQMSLTMDVPGAERLATVTFLVIIGTVLIYGISASPLARWLGLASRKSNGLLIAGGDEWVRDFASELTKCEIPVLIVDTNFNKVSQARVAGLEAICANILNEHVQENLPLTGIGRMMSMTPNDEVNSLAIRECRSMFGRANVFQLPFDHANTHHSRGMPKNLMGRELFGAEMTFDAIQELHQLGASFKATPLSDTFTYEDFSERFGANAKLLCAIDEDRTMTLQTTENPLKPEAGQTIITLATSTTVPGGHAAVNGEDETTS